jgi:hypothetical protein
MQVKIFSLSDSQTCKGEMRLQCTTLLQASVST